jgi:acyl-coenzyme A thioesterase PaaI-like protein
MPAADQPPVSAARVAEQLGELLPEAASLPPAAFELVEEARGLVEAVVMTDVDPAERRRAAARIAAITEQLRARRRPEAMFLVRHPDGRIESMMQAAAGQLNPQALPIEWVHRPTEPPPGTVPTAVEVTARCTFTAAHGGSPGRVHGGVLALALDEVTGVAVRAAGASGMTVALEVSLRGGVPYGIPVDLAARYTGGEGRKALATGEVRVDGSVMATANAVYVAERR